MTVEIRHIYFFSLRIEKSQMVKVVGRDTVRHPFRSLFPVYRSDIKVVVHRKMVAMDEKE
jgi:hypothetical protein